MSYRILHCGSSIANYNLCVNEQVAGFLNRGPSTGDVIFLAVKIGKKSFCSVRAVLAEPTDIKPWQDSEKYVNCFTLENIKYCNPFSLEFLSTIGGKYWSLKYLQGAKEIKDREAIDQLICRFDEDIRSEFVSFDITQKIPLEEIEIEDESEAEEEPIARADIEEVIQEVPDAKVKIMGTFQTVNFKNETDAFKGLEPLVNENFYYLFPAYPESRTILIPENRLFISSGVEARGDKFISGIKSIPDALLILFNKKQKLPIQINLIEYECYGEGKIRTSDKSNYMNGQIIPQLMKFSSSFSIVTDKQIRSDTISNWVDKIINYVFSEDELQRKFTEWIQEIEPGVSDKLIAYKMNRLLSDAFRTNVRVILIIDELSQEQRDTITNVIKAFRMENGESISFTAYIVRLEQKINIIDSVAEFALSVQ